MEDIEKLLEEAENAKFSSKPTDYIELQRRLIQAVRELQAENARLKVAATAWLRCPELELAKAALIEVLDSQESKVIVSAKRDIIVSCPVCSLCEGGKEHHVECYFYHVKKALAAIEGGKS